ncbi:TolB family protein [Bacteroidota bacterium]
MKDTLLSSLLVFFLILFTGCEKNEKDNEVLPRQLTSTNLDYKCFWSPNGEYIAFFSTRNTNNPMASIVIFELWIMDKNGSNQRPLLSYDELYESTNAVHVSWSMNSDALLAHIYTPNGSEIWKVSIDGNKTRLSSLDHWAERPKYSHDGSKVAFIIQGPNPLQGSPVYRLYSANSDFSDTILIEKGLISDYDWIKGSEGFVYSLYDYTNENFDLWKSSIDGTNKLRISETPSDNEEILSCSYDGKYIAYTDHNAVYITPLDEFNSSLIMGSARLQKWIPNKDLILLYCYQSQDDKSWTESWVVDINGEVIKKISEGNYSETAFSFSGDYFSYTLDGNIWIDKLP